MGAEVVLREGDAEGGIGGKVELSIALAPVLDDSNVHRRGSASTVDFGHVGGGESLTGVDAEEGWEERGGDWWGFVYAGSKRLDHEARRRRQGVLII